MFRRDVGVEQEKVVRTQGRGQPGDRNENGKRCADRNCCFRVAELWRSAQRDKDARRYSLPHQRRQKKRGNVKWRNTYL